MASPDVLDFDALFAPIEGDNPAGVDVRSDGAASSLYYQIKDARSSARAAERQSAAGDAEARADWRPVLRHGEKALKETTKDLEIVAYMIEALVRLEGFAGLRDGFKLASGLVERYWDHLYPQPDEDGIPTRVAPLTSLNGDDAEGTLIQPIAMVPLTEGSSEGPFARYHYEQAATIEQLPDEEAKQKRIEQSGVSMAKLTRAASETPAAFFVQIHDDIEQCQEAFAQMTTALDERAGSDSPPASNIRAALDACRDVVNSLGRDKLAVAASDDSAAEGDAAPAANGAPTGPPGAIRGRDDALQSLLKVADFFRRTEPHNPVSYALEQAVRWSRMSLPELMTELIPDEGSRAALFKQVGIKPPSEG